MIKMLEFIVEHPDKYSEVLEAAISDGEIDVGMMPEQYDQVFIISLLVALYGLHRAINKARLCPWRFSCCRKETRCSGQRMATVC